MSRPSLQGVSHVALTVCDLERSASWYERVLGATRIAATDLAVGHPIVLVACGPLMVGLHRDDRVPGDDRFSEFRVGLDHLSFYVPSRGAVDAWARRLDELGVEHSGPAEAEYGTVLVFRDPDNIQLEVMAPPRAGAGEAEPTLHGISHVALTVSDVESRGAWYREVFGPVERPTSSREPGRSRECFTLSGDVRLCLKSFAETPAGDTFSEFRCGLDHLSFACASRGDLESWKARLEDLGVPTGDIVDAPYGGVLVFRDPDNIQLELFAPPQ